MKAAYCRLAVSAPGSIVLLDSLAPLARRAALLVAAGDEFMLRGFGVAVVRLP